MRAPTRARIHQTQPLKEVIMQSAGSDGEGRRLAAARLRNCYTTTSRGAVRAIAMRLATSAIALGLVAGAAATPASAAASGDLMWYRDLNNNGTPGWAF